MSEPRKGNQTPTVERVHDYSASYGADASDLYSKTGRTAQEWQNLLLCDILAYQPDGLWVHTKFGYSVPRRNGKNEVVSIRELYGLHHGERILHTAHRTTTSHSAAMRLSRLLDDMGYEEVIRQKKGETYDKHYVFSKQFGLEKITLLGEGGGVCDFRTRTSKGGLGEGFDLLVIDEAQEYTDDQESSLKYVVTDSKNPQTVFCGTPPTAVSGGTVFQLMRKNVLAGEAGDNSGWAEWSIDERTDPKDKEAWYLCNPSLGTIFTERSIMDEVGSDELDFNIQRLGLWVSYDQKSAITEQEWKMTESSKVPQLKPGAFVGIKYGKDGTNVSVSVACRTQDSRIFVTAYDCRNVREGDLWIVEFIKKVANLRGIVIDGANGTERLVKDLKEFGVKKTPTVPTSKEFIVANAAFELAIYNDGLWHMPQPSVDRVVTNCDKRAIGSNGGFGYRSTIDTADISLMDSMILAYWLCSETKERKIQKVYY